MMCYGFEWDERKSRANLAKHGIDFHTAALAFDDPFALTMPDELRNECGPPGAEGRKKDGELKSPLQRQNRERAGKAQKADPSTTLGMTKRGFFKQPHHLGSRSNSTRKGNL